MHTSAAHAMLALGAPAPHPVRKVAHLLCDAPSPPAPVPAAPTKRPRAAQWTRGHRGRFVERPFPTPAPSSPAPSPHAPAAAAAATSVASAPGVSRMPGRVAKRAAKKYYANPTPSAHCHVCARTAKAVRFAVCARIAHGLCRKVICDKCFAKFGWDWDAAVADRNWTCVHCRGVCPEGRSQCFIYSRVNRRRETKRGARAAAAARAHAATASASASTSGRAAPLAQHHAQQHHAQQHHAQQTPPPPRFGDAGFASQHMPAHMGVPPLQMAPATAPYPPMGTAYAAPAQDRHGQRARTQALPSLLRPDAGLSGARLPCSPLPPLPAVGFSPPGYSSMSSLSMSRMDSGPGQYGSVSPGSDVTATSNEAELRYARAMPLSLQR